MLNFYNPQLSFVGIFKNLDPCVKQGSNELVISILEGEIGVLLSKRGGNDIWSSIKLKIDLKL